MKKHDEGYVLAYVTVVLLVFCLVATTILTGALQNLQNQQNAIAKMQDQYAAEGMIEQIVAQWSACVFAVDEPVKIDQTDSTVICTAKDSEKITLSATSGMVTIICELDANGKYISYEVGAATPAEGEEVPQ